MRCAEFKIRLDAVLDQRRSPTRDPGLNAHARHCLECAEWMTAHVDLLMELENSPSISPLPDFALRVLQDTVAVERRISRRKVWERSAMALAAAGLLIALIPWHSSNLLPAPSIPANRANFDPKASAFENHYVELAQTTRNLASDLTAQQLALVGEVAEGFRPVTHSVYAALHTLWRTVPGNELARSLL